ncbi:hypothetical protein [Streptomyces sp. NPDC057794]
MIRAVLDHIPPVFGHADSEYLLAEVQDAVEGLDPLEREDYPAAIRALAG